MKGEADMIVRIIKNLENQSGEQSDIRKEIEQACTFLRKILHVENESAAVTENLQLYEHSLKVALRLSEWELNRHIVKAGLLHALVLREDGKKIDTDVMKRIREEVDTKVDDILRAYNTMSFKLERCEKRISKGESVRESFRENFSASAFYILVAHRAEKLLREENHPSGETIQLAQITEGFLIPEIKKLNAFYLVDILEEICFKISNRTQYDKISAQVSDMQNMNRVSLETFRKDMADLFNKDNPSLPPVLQKYQKYIADFYSVPRTFNSLHRYLVTADFMENPKFATEQNGIAHYVLNLIFKDPPVQKDPDYPDSIVSLFLQFYSDLTTSGYYKPRFTLHHFAVNHDYVHTSFLISDESDNFYFLTLRTESEYRVYRYGNMFSKNPDEWEEEDAKIIPVKKKDGSVIFVPKGYTVLDLAFKIHSEIGLNFHYAIVNGNEQPYFYVLKPGDHVEIVHYQPGYGPGPDFTWIKHVDSSHSFNELLRYFRSHYRPFQISVHSLSDEKLMNETSVNEPAHNHVSSNAPVQTSERKKYQGQDLSIKFDSGATILDYAFHVYGEKALYFDHGCIGKDRQVCSIDHQLQSGDAVDVVFADTVQATMDWLLYVNTLEAKQILIEHFKKGL